ncbi:MAG: hypothetical protein AAFN74_02160 [Myxococcota bacterium]
MYKVTIKTGKRTWTLTVVKTDRRGTILVSDAGLEYRLSGGLMAATSVGRDESTRRYTWSVTNYRDVARAIERSKPIEQRAALAIAKIQAWADLEEQIESEAA